MVPGSPPPFMRAAQGSTHSEKRPAAIPARVPAASSLARSTTYGATSVPPPQSWQAPAQPRRRLLAGQVQQQRADQRLALGVGPGRHLLAQEELVLPQPVEDAGLGRLLHLD